MLNLDGEPVEATHFRIECVAGRVRMHLPQDCPLLGSPLPGAPVRAQEEQCQRARSGSVPKPLQ